MASPQHPASVPAVRDELRDTIEAGFNPRRDALNAIEVALCVEGAVALGIIFLAAFMFTR